MPNAFRSQNRLSARDNGYIYRSAIKRARDTSGVRRLLINVNVFNAMALSSTQVAPRIIAQSHFSKRLLTVSKWINRRWLVNIVVSWLKVASIKNRCYRWSLHDSLLWKSLEWSDRMEWSYRHKCNRNEIVRPFILENVPQISDSRIARWIEPLIKIISKWDFPNFVSSSSQFLSIYIFSDLR